MPKPASRGRLRAVGRWPEPTNIDNQRQLARRSQMEVCTPPQVGSVPHHFYDI
jgi:hypothetical protein